MAKRGMLSFTVRQGPTPRPSEEEDRAKALAALAATFGLASFRPLQLEAVLAALGGRDALLLLPTGGGKSLCYTVPALVRPGTVTLVVSPLIALMEDQVTNLRRRGVHAARLSSTQPAAERRAVLQDVQSAAPRTQLLFATPELLATPAFLAVLAGVYARGRLLLAAVDEAHCISSYGCDFRPAYRCLGALRRELPSLPIMALTATASPAVREDIIASLALRAPLRLAASFDRPNLRLEVRYVDLLRGPGGAALATPLSDLADLLGLPQQPQQGGGQQQQQDRGQQQQQRQQGGGQQQQQQKQQKQQQPASPSGRAAIVYCLKRDTADGVAAALARRGAAAAAYHAGLPDAERSRVLAEWTAGRLSVVAATVAFGMGIDRGDVGLVVHYNLPKSLEAYYQEAGRAGRDGAPARCVLYYSTADRQSMEFVLSKGGTGGAGGGPGGAGSSGAGGPGGGQPSDLQAFGGVVEYCTQPACRRAALLRHFGEELPASAGGRGGAACCDVCEDRPRVEAVLRELALAGARRQQAFQHGRRTEIDLGGGGGAGGSKARGFSSALDFERERPGEGLDFDGEPQGGGGAESDAEADASEEEGAEEARAAAKRARGGGGGNDLGSVMEALAAAAARQEAAAAQRGGHARLLAKLEGGGGGGGGPARAAPRAPTPLSAQQLSQQVEAAAAAAATQPQTEAAVQRAVRLLARLQGQPVSAGLLQQTGAGKRVRGLEKHPHPAIAAAAAAVVEAWKQRVLGATG